VNEKNIVQRQLFIVVEMEWIFSVPVSFIIVENGMNVFIASVVYRCRNGTNVFAKTYNTTLSSKKKCQLNWLIERNWSGWNWMTFYTVIHCAKVKHPKNCKDSAPFTKCKPKIMVFWTIDEEIKFLDFFRLPMEFLSFRDANKTYFQSA